MPLHNLDMPFDLFVTDKLATISDAKKQFF